MGQMVCNLIRYKIVSLWIACDSVLFKSDTGQMACNLIQYKIVSLRIACDSV